MARLHPFSSVINQGHNGKNDSTSAQLNVVVLDSVGVCTLHNRLVNAHHLDNSKLVKSNTMGQKKNDCFPDLCRRFMSCCHHGDITHYPPETTTMFSGAQLLALTPNQVVRHFNFLVYGNSDPGTNKLPKHMRKCTIQYKKKAMSACMSHHGEWNAVTNHGNPTQDKSVLAMIARMGKFQTRGQGKKSQVKRDLTMPEMKLCMEILDSDATTGHSSSGQRRLALNST